MCRRQGHSAPASRPRHLRAGAGRSCIVTGNILYYPCISNVFLCVWVILKQEDNLLSRLFSTSPVSLPGFFIVFSASFSAFRQHQKVKNLFYSIIRVYTHGFNLSSEILFSVYVTNTSPLFPLWAAQLPRFQG